MGISVGLPQLRKDTYFRHNQFSQVHMYRGLVTSGMMLAIFGAFLVLTDWYVPLGVSVFGFPISVAGAVMLAVGFLKSEPQPIEPEPGKKFCWYCMNQIPEDSKQCPSCSLPQHEARD